MTRIRIAHLGASGSFTEEAALLHAGRAGLDAELLGAPTPDAVLAALSSEAADLAVLPVANTTAGLVRAVLDALGRVHPGRVEVEAEVDLPVRLALLARPGVALAEVERVASHPLALLQSAATLARLLPGRGALEWSDTGAAARDLAAGVLPATTAVVASARAGVRHGLALLAAGVQDREDNRTLFAVLRRPSRSGVE